MLEEEEGELHLATEFLAYRRHEFGFITTRFKILRHILENL